MTKQPARKPNGPFTGWHMTGILVAFFGVVIVVNLLMARNAISTFGGVVVENSYVASQNFNGWLEADKAQAKLGWSVAAERLPDGRVSVRATGPGSAATLSGEARHPLGRQRDFALSFTPVGAGTFVSREVLPQGRWTVRLQLAENGQAWRGELPLR